MSLLSVHTTRTGPHVVMRSPPFNTAPYGRAVEICLDSVNPDDWKVTFYAHSPSWCMQEGEDEIVDGEERRRAIKDSLAAFRVFATN